MLPVVFARRLPAASMPITAELARFKLKLSSEVVVTVGARGGDGVCARVTFYIETNENDAYGFREFNFTRACRRKRCPLSRVKKKKKY